MEGKLLTVLLTFKLLKRLLALRTLVRLSPHLPLQIEYSLHLIFFPIIKNKQVI